MNEKQAQKLYEQYVEIEEKLHHYLDALPRRGKHDNIGSIECNCPTKDEDGNYCVLTVEESQEYAETACFTCGGHR